MKNNTARAALLAQLADMDDGTGLLATVVKEALEGDEVTPDEVRQMMQDALDVREDEARAA